MVRARPRLLCMLSKFTPLIRNGLLSLGFAVSTLLTGSMAHAQSISNVASASWQVGTTPYTAPSNRVDVTVVTPPPQPVTIRTLGFTSSGTMVTPTSATMCMGTSGPVAINPRAGDFASGTAPNSAPQTSFYAGDTVIVRMMHSAANVSATTIDTVDVTLTSANGERELITLRETGVNTGEFAGFITTIATPPAPVQGDCRLSVDRGTTISYAVTSNGAAPVTANVNVTYLVDPYGVSFDSGDGAPVSGTQITLVDAVTGQPARVYGDDGVSSYPSTVITGTSVTDSGGTLYTFGTGDYRFPLVTPGTYRLIVTPPSGYTAPSTQPPSALAGFVDPTTQRPYTITGASYGDSFTMTDPTPVRIDIPLDRPGTPLVLSKTASVATAYPGDVIAFRITVRNADAARATGAITLTDVMPPTLRLRANTVRVNGVLQNPSFSNESRRFAVVVPALAGGASADITYLADVVTSARPGTTINVATARDNRGTESNTAQAAVRIIRDAIGDRITIIGRVTDQGCATTGAKGIPGVRVVLQDGSYVVTDIDGRYHFDGVRPGLHVVQMEAATLPAGLAPHACATNVRAAGSAISRFVERRGGALLRADFQAIAANDATAAAPVAPAKPRPEIASDQAAAGAAANWFATSDATPAWLFPDTHHNPRSKTVRIAIRHPFGTKVELMRGGQPVQATTSEGVRSAPGDAYSVSLWRAVPLEYGPNAFSARIVDNNGAVIATLPHTVHYSGNAVRAVLVKEMSSLVADGVTRPVIAVRLTDAQGRPVRHGVTGPFAVPTPYYAAVEADAQTARQIAGMERAQPVWRVEGDDGLAFIELEPTTASGALKLTLPLRDGEINRSIELETWLDAGNRPWTVVGFAAGTVGYNTLKERMDPVAEELATWNTDARLALYAKGRVKGKWLLTLAYDSDKARDDARFGGTIDPQAYYTIYADHSERRDDAASIRKLYVRLERPQFYALFGDYETALSETELSRYHRAVNGVRSEYRGRNFGVSAFAADTPTRYRREDIQGNGLSSPYALKRRDILPNSDRITIEVRDRLRSDRIVSRAVLVRYVDYDIDYLAGTLRFRTPVLSRDSQGNPQFIVAEYEIEMLGRRKLNAGGRVTWRNDTDTLRLGATAVREQGNVGATTLGGVDLRYRPTAMTEVRAEAAMSRGRSDAATAQSAATTPPQPLSRNARAWLVEVEHHDGMFDVLAYAREQERGFGVGQTAQVESGTRKIGLDGRLRLGTPFTLTGSAWQQDALDSDVRRRAARILGEYRTQDVDLRAGLTHADDQLSGGKRKVSNLVTLGATKRLFDRKLELGAQTEFALGGKDASVDFPTRTRFDARVAVAQDVTLIGSYELASGETIKARTARLGFDLKPWAGARFTASANQQQISEYGPRTFAAFGLAQSVQINPRWTVDATVDANKTLRGPSRSDIVSEGHPVATGGFVGDGSMLAEDFTAVTLGATYRGDRWTANGRAEWRNGDTGERRGLQLGIIRQLGEGRALGGMFSWGRASGSADGASTQAMAAQLSWAHRPAESRVSWLNKAEVRFDTIRNATAGTTGPVGGAPMRITGDARSRRVTNSLSLNWTGRDTDEVTGTWQERSEVALFWGTRYAFDSVGADHAKGWSNLFGGDVRFDLTKSVAVGASGTLRIGTGNSNRSWSGGPTITVSPAKDTAVTLGYNFAGFTDRDFEEQRYARGGVYLTFKLKFDHTTLEGLGLNGLRR